MPNRTRSILVGLKALSSCKMHPWTRSWSIRIAASMQLLVLTDRYKIWIITLRLLCQPSTYRTWQDHRPQYLCTVNKACFNPLMQPTSAGVVLCYRFYFALFQNYSVAITMKTFTYLMLHTGMYTHVHTACVCHMQAYTAMEWNTCTGHE